MEINEIDEIDEIGEINEINEIQEINEIHEIHEIEEINEIHEFKEINEKPPTHKRGPRHRARSAIWSKCWCCTGKIGQPNRALNRAL